jgi:hypothetical protein
VAGFYARFKKFGSDEYMSFHAENGSGRSDSCWEKWMEQNLNLRYRTHRFHGHVVEFGNANHAT